MSLEDAREKVGIWLEHYDGDRPHGALGNLAPLESAKVEKAGEPAKLTPQLLQYIGG